MATVVFYEKPGCITNKRQRRLLEASGHRVEARSLLAEPWTSDRLLAFFGDAPVSRWFNNNAPRVRSGEIDPQKMGPGTALFLMIADPLLIRRPLIEVNGRKLLGFDAKLLDGVIGLSAHPESAADPEGCSHPKRDSGTRPACAVPETA